MTASTPSGDTRQQFADFVAQCRFFDAVGFVDAERLCAHLHLCLFCDGVETPGPTDFYVLLLNTLSKVAAGSGRDRLRREPVTGGDDRYYPEGVRTLVHVDLLAAVYADWIRRVGVELLAAPDDDQNRGRFWVRGEWSLTRLYLSRLEAELARLAGLSRLLSGGPGH